MHVTFSHAGSWFSVHSYIMSTAHQLYHGFLRSLENVVSETCYSPHHTDSDEDRKPTPKVVADKIARKSAWDSLPPISKVRRWSPALSALIIISLLNNHLVLSEVYRVPNAPTPRPKQTFRRGLHHSR